MAETVALIDPDGTSWTMHDAATTDNAIMLGIDGLFSPPYQLFGDEVPLEAGERISHVRLLPRTLLIPFRIYADTETALRAAVRSWSTRFNPTRGAATVRWTGPDATSRDLAVRLSGGAEGTVDDRSSGWDPWFQTLVLTFRASDPLWYDTSTSVESFSSASSATFFPFFPLSLSSSEVFGEVAISNGGDLHTWPTITITGPATDPIIRNVTTSKLLDLTGVTLSAGESVTIDTTPGVKTVLKQDGTNLFSSLSSDSSLWRLERGSNTVRVEMAGTDANSAVTVSYRRRWLSV